jgi:glyoxylase-like metal-dependent hydrolase (beta-lactamase superfamily II)
MRIHHLNCISTCPVGGHLMDGRTPGVLTRGHLCCHCLLLETDAGLVLVDTGLGLGDCASPRTRLSAFFLALLKPEFREEMTAARQVEQLGYKRGDVRHIVLTHLDFDHAGGLDDFPNASIHMTDVEARYALLQKTWLDRQRFRPQQWGSTRPQWRVYGQDRGERWFGFDAVIDLHGLPDDILLVPLPGHTHGHAGVAVRDADGHWLLQAADAYFFHREMDLERPWCTPGLRFYQVLMEKDRKARLENQRRLRELRRAHGSQVTICCGHDPIEFEQLTGRPMGTPAREYAAGLAGAH